MPVSVRILSIAQLCELLEMAPEQFVGINPVWTHTGYHVDGRKQYRREIAVYQETTHGTNERVAAAGERQHDQAQAEEAVTVPNPPRIG